MRPHPFVHCNYAYHARTRLTCTLPSIALAFEFCVLRVYLFCVMRTSLTDIVLVHTTASACNRLKRQFHSNSLPNHSVSQVCREGCFSSRLARHFELPRCAIQEFEFMQSAICTHTKFARNTQNSAIDGTSRTYVSARVRGRNASGRATLRAARQ